MPTGNLIRFRNMRNKEQPKVVEHIKKRLSSRKGKHQSTGGTSNSDEFSA
jgi:hypothetical protein